MSENQKWDTSKMVKIETNLGSLQAENEKLRTENNYYCKELGRLHREFNFMKKKMVTVVEQRNHYIKAAKMQYPDNERYECDRTLELMK